VSCLICGAAHTKCPGTTPAPQFIIDLEVEPMASNLYTSDRRLYLNADSKVVEADDPSRVSLLVPEGGTIPMADAEKYGLTTPVAPVKAAPPANKAKLPSENK
jgi:hypothetical protein